MNILYLVLYNKEKRITFTKYFDTEFEMDKFIRRMYFFKNLILIEDSRDIYFFWKGLKDMGSFILGFILGGFMGIVLIALVKAGDNKD